LNLFIDLNGLNRLNVLNALKGSKSSSRSNRSSRLKQIYFESPFISGNKSCFGAWAFFQTITLRE
jgi:hypothetical protein